MDFNNTCIRCGKPCPEGEFMCAACHEWLEQQEGLPTMEEATAEEAEVIPAAETVESAAEEAAAPAEEAGEAPAEEETKYCRYCQYSSFI